jgi:cell division protein FtsQ
MRQGKTPSLRGSVTQNNVSVRVEDEARLGVVARLGLMIAFLIAVMLFIGWLFHSSWPQRQFDKAVVAWIGLTRTAGFSVNDVTVQGSRHTERKDILEALDVKRGDAIFAFDADAAAERLGKLPWVESVIVQRRLPGAVNVSLAERTPMARWQYENKISVIDTKGQILPAARPDDFADLPAVVGADANEKAAELISTLGKYPDIAALTSSSVRVGERRWDLHLNPKTVVKLPETGLKDALGRLETLIMQEKILERGIVAVDLRIADRYTIEPAPQDAAPSATGATRP